MFLAEVDTTAVILAGIGAVVAIVNGLGIALVYAHLRTPSGTRIGKQVENALHTALANNYRLQAMGGELDVRMPDVAAEEEARVEGHNTIQTKAQRASNG